ncbi:MAG: endonuclease III [Treponema sp.]|jgi:endonuclease-3|nr:endonuclease III [Treponema sp.]
MKADANLEIPWGPVVRALEKWRGNLEDPSVTMVAEQYSRNPWAVLVSTILSLRTKDEVTLAASARLLKEAPGPAELSGLEQDAIARLAYPAGFYRTKAANLKKIAAILLDTYDGEVPSSMDELLALPGVGRKTANLVLIEAFDLPGICVDVHVHRICNRAGWVQSRNPEETETALRNCLPRRYWKGINALLVLYGQQTCRPVSPYCSRCVISEYCLRRGVERSR